MMNPLHNSILAFGFLTPWLMGAGAAATSIPIIIHLLNKRKFKIVIWAAMEWLLAAQRRNARRLRFQRWLLLAVRCLAILVLAAGVAQLILQSKALAILGSEQRAVIILWDDSYSMGYQNPKEAGSPNATTFERARRLARDAVDHLQSADKVLLIRTSRVSAALDPGKPTADHSMVTSLIDQAQLSDASTDLPTAFDRASEALKALETTTPNRQVLLITDFTNSSIHDPVRGAGAENRVQGLAGDRLKKAVEGMVGHLPHSADFRVLDVGMPDQNNRAVVSIRPRRPAVVAGIPADFDVTVYNGTDTPMIDQTLSVMLDGVELQKIKLQKIDPGSAVDAQVRDLRVPTIGKHLLEARLPADLLPADDVRRMILNVRREVPVLLVDGRPGNGGNPTYDSTGYLWIAYSDRAPSSTLQPATGPAPEQLSMFAPKTITESEFSNTPLSNYDIIALSDVGRMDETRRNALKKFVEAGGLLLIFPGENSGSSGETLNGTFGEKGANLLPATLQQRREVPADQSLTFDPENYNHPVLHEFAPQARQGKRFLDLVNISKYFVLGTPTDGSTDIILRFANPDHTAAVVKKDVGKGSVVLFATTADTLWNTWGGKPTFLVFLHELTYYAMGRDNLNGGAGLTLRPGDQIQLPAEVGAPGTWSGPRDSTVDVTSQTDADGRAFLTSKALSRAGTYTPPLPNARPLVAVNPDPEEADIRPVSKEQMAGALGVETQNIVDAADATGSVAVEKSGESGSALGAKLLIGALGLFLVETVLALLFSTYR